MEHSSKKINLNLHAKKQISEREIDEEIVKKVLLHPSQIVESYNGRKIAQSLIEHSDEKFLIRIVYEETEKDLKIITVYLTTKIEKYWR